MNKLKKFWIQRHYSAGSFSDLDDYISKNYIEEKAVFAAAGAASQAKAFMGAAMSATGDMARKAIKPTFARSAQECVPREIPEEESEVSKKKTPFSKPAHPPPSENSKTLSIAWKNRLWKWYSLLPIKKA